MKAKFPYDDSILFLISSSHWNLHGQLKNRFTQEGFDVTPDQYYVLLNLLKEGSMFQSQLAVSLNKDRAAIKRLVDRLEKKELVKRKKIEFDKRKKLIILSPKGKEWVDKMIPLAKKTFDHACRALTEVELSALKRLIRKLR